MKDYVERLNVQERDSVTYRDVVSTARRVFEGGGFDFSQSIDIKTSNPTLLFNISGGVRYESVLSGDEAPPTPSSIASVQRCIRSDSLSKIGYSGRHHIAFDMLGHFNFFDHDELGAKQVAIVSAHQLLQELNIKDLFARCHPDDDISKSILASLGVDILEDASNIHVCNNERRSGNRVEFGRMIGGSPTEMWNIVFTLYEGIDDSRTPLSRVAFDSGASLDRLITAANGKETDYETRHWRDVIEQIDNRVPYGIACRAADFARAASVLTQSGVAPGSKKQEYVARKVFSELARLEASNPNLDVGNILHNVTTMHDTRADTRELLGIYEAEVARVARVVALGARAVQARLKKSAGVLSSHDYEYLRSTHGLDQEAVECIAKSS